MACRLARAERLLTGTESRLADSHALDRLDKRSLRALAALFGSVQFGLELMRAPTRRGELCFEARQLAIALCNAAIERHVHCLEIARRNLCRIGHHRKTSALAPLELEVARHRADCQRVDCLARTRRRADAAKKTLCASNGSRAPLSHSAERGKAGAHCQIVSHCVAGTVFALEQRHVDALPQIAHHGGVVGRRVHQSAHVQRSHVRFRFAHRQ